MNRIQSTFASSFGVLFGQSFWFSRLWRELLRLASPDKLPKPQVLFLVRSASPVEHKRNTSSEKPKNPRVSFPIQESDNDLLHRIYTGTLRCKHSASSGAPHQSEAALRAQDARPGLRNSRRPCQFFEQVKCINNSAPTANGRTFGDVPSRQLALPFFRRPQRCGTAAHKSMSRLP